MARLTLSTGLAGLALLGASLVAAGPKENLMTLADRYWEDHLRTNPTEATSIGDHRYDAFLRNDSAEGIAAETGRLEALRREVQALAPETLDPADRVTRSLLLREIGNDLDRIACDFDAWDVGPRGPQSRLLNIPSYQTLEGPESGRAMVERWRAMAAYLRTHTENLKRGLAGGRVASVPAVERALEQLDGLEKTPVEDWSLLEPLKSIPSSWDEAARETFRRDLTAAVTDSVRPALLAYRDFLRETVLPRARPAEKAGLTYLPGGDECYRRLIHLHTSLDLDADAIHEIGLAEVAKINRETRTLGANVLGTDDLEEIHRRLRTDPALHFTTRDEVQQTAEAALARAEAAIPAWFGRLPQAPCIVKRVPAHEEKITTIAYYRGPAVDGSRPGAYYVNTYAPETRPRYEAEVLAFHEAVPGHHLQISIAQELGDLPAFRRHGGTTAYVEGWALYTERLADEMGLYSGDLDRMGMLSFDSWRACRLVVDTGIHARGWSRQKAIDYLLANTCLAENNIVNEVDRYITSPGQALAYKLGQREIFALRRRAKEALGERFDIRAFHDTILGGGAVDLATLRSMVDNYIEANGGE